MPAIYNSKTDKAMLELPGLQITDLDCSGQDLSFGKFTSSTIAATLTWYLVMACIVVAAPTIEDLIGVSKGVFQRAALMMPALAGPSRQSTYKASLKVLDCAFLVFIPIIAIEYALLKFKVALPTGPLWIVCCSVVTLCAVLGFNHIYLRECRQVKDYFQFERINFTGAQLTYTDWNRSSVKHTTFNHADLSYARFENTGIFKCNLSSCKLPNLKALKSNLQECLIADAVLTSAAFNAVRISNSRFSGSDLSRTRFTNCNFDGVSFSRASLCGTDFSTSKFTSCDFTSAIADDKTKWPKGFNPATNGVNFT